ncbi:hypothetical protein JGU66_15420 [Myxococcaceae bacterium JPH2]|nr:hypothetical protein [Myxococcaceae bacterium JPH2]
MRSVSLSRLLLVTTLVWGGAALAQPARRHPQDFQAPQAQSAEEREAAKQRAMGGNINSYGRDIVPKEPTIPWMAVGLAIIVLTVATPFAIRAYRGTAKEIDSHKAFGDRHEDSEEDEAA